VTELRSAEGSAADRVSPHGRDAMRVNKLTSGPRISVTPPSSSTVVVRCGTNNPGLPVGAKLSMNRATKEMGVGPK
jgi:hypothetical protein